MIKGLVFCFAFLVAQLLVLHYIDGRFQSNSKDARQVTTTTTVIQRDEETEDQDAQS
ncbi:hypothetical protein [Pistricoccus aurantiacus]|uniref:hypothetical protein n=1 Tax=Pistricoccus aurantiacus TaxID=1883414 RepID=UPI001646A0CB|nr:hypothetical protein [Pistricoccus aurantiacus]